MKPPAKMSSLLGLLPLYFPRALGGLEDRIRARRLVRGLGSCDITVVRRPALLQTGLLVFELRRGSWSVVVKHPRKAHGAATVARERDILRQLQADERLSHWHPLLPRVVGSPGPAGTLAQSRLPGVPAEQLIRDAPYDPYRAAAPALRLLADLRGVAGRRRPAAERALPWYESQLTVLSQAIPRYADGRRVVELRALRHHLDAALADAVLTEGWTHGDYHPGNVLLGGDPLRVTGVFDWGDACADGPCEIDACTFVLALRCLRTGRSLGALVAETLRSGLSDTDRALLALAGVHPGHDSGDLSALVLLTWLWHVTGNLRKSPKFGHNHWWLTNTVAPVLRECAHRRGPDREHP